MTVSLNPFSHGSGGRGSPIEPERWIGLAVLVGDEALAVDDLEGDLVDVHRVRIGGEVVELPDLGVAHAAGSR